MVQSMTGFGSAEKDGYRVEIRSLNSRFLDIYVKAPSFLSQFDIPFRNLLKDRFARGKFDITISVSENVSADFTVNTVVAGRLYAAFKKLQETLALPGDIDIRMIAGLHNLYLDTDVTYNADTVHAVFGQAMDGLEEMRCREGGVLAAELLKLADSLESMNDKIRNVKGDTIREITGKFHERINVLLAEKDIDDSRILQEAAIIAMKLDIAEEIARIDSHIRQFREIVSTHDIIGRKLDFIVQELNREINTISAKSGDYGIASLTVEMKAVAEKIKEQVQNLQ